MNQSPSLQKNNSGIVKKISVCSFIIFTSSLFISLQVHAATSYAVFTLTPGVKQLSKSKVRMLFRGKMKLVQGKAVELSDWPQANNIRNEFYQGLLGKDLAQMNAYWAGISFSGKARPPKEMESDSVDVLIKWLSAKRFRISYAPMELLPENANVLYIVKKEKQ